MMHGGFGSGFGHHTNWFCGPTAFFHGPMSWLISLFFWGGIIYLTVKFVASLTANTPHAPQDYPEILKERYARGEIAREEYDRMKAELK